MDVLCRPLFTSPPPLCRGWISTFSCVVLWLPGLRVLTSDPNWPIHFYFRIFRVTNYFHVCCLHLFFSSSCPPSVPYLPLAQQQEGPTVELGPAQGFFQLKGWLPVKSLIPCRCFVLESVSSDARSRRVMNKVNWIAVARINFSCLSIKCLILVWKKKQKGLDI